MEKQLNSETKRKILIQLLNKGDPKRRQELLSHYFQYFAQNYSTGWLIEFINDDLKLERPINRKDIKYIKEYLIKKHKTAVNEKITNSNIPIFQNKNIEIEKLNLDEIDFREFKPKSKKLI